MKAMRTISKTLLAISLAATFAHAEVGVGDGSVRIGMSAPFSGPNGAYGVEMRETIAAYFAQVNAAGGVHGRKLELVAKDDGYETDRTVANTKTLLNDEKVFALVGYYGSSPTTEAMKVFSAQKTPLVGTISGADTLRAPKDRYMFHVRASYADETATIVNQLVALHMTKIAVFYQNDGFGRSGLDGVTAALRKHDLAPVASGTVERNSLDVAAAVEAIAKSDAQAVVMVTLYKPTAEFVRQLNKAGKFPTLMTLSPVGAENLMTELGRQSSGIGISQVMPHPNDDGVPLVREYKRLMATEGRTFRPSYYGLEALVNAKVLVDAMRKAGRDITREKLVDVLERTSSDLGGYKVAYASNSHNGSSWVDLTIIGSRGKLLR